MLNLLKSDFYMLLRTKAVVVIAILLALTCVGGVAMQSLAASLQASVAAEESASATDSVSDSSAIGSGASSVDAAVSGASASGADASAPSAGSSANVTLNGISEAMANGGATGAFMAMMMSLLAVILCARDFEDGFAKNVLNGRRRVYFAEKLLFIGLVCLAFMVLASLVAVVCFMASGATIADGEDPLQLIVWFALSWLVVCFYAVLSAVVVWISGSRMWGTVVAVLFGFGVVGGLLTVGLGFLGNSGPLSSLAGLADWLPSNAFAALGSGASSLGAIGQTGVPVVLQCFVVSIVPLALCVLATRFLVRNRDFS